MDKGGSWIRIDHFKVKLTCFIIELGLILSNTNLVCG